jgi:hypothetical protein
MTLIELLAGLVVLGTVLASISLARGRFLRQWSEAEQRMQATRVVDRMLADWLGGPADRVPVPGQGTLLGMKQHVWRTTPRRDRAVEDLGAMVVRLEVFERTESTAASRRPVVSVDFVLPRGEQEAR